MNIEMLKNLLYEYKDSPDLLFEAYKRGCQDEREAAKQRVKSFDKSFIDKTEYKLTCTKSDRCYTHFTLYDRKNLINDLTRNSCGNITIDTRDLIHFIKHTWNGDIDWCGNYPSEEIERQTSNHNKHGAGKNEKPYGC